MIEGTVRVHPQNMLRCFEAIYILNLPERRDRLRDTMAQLLTVDSAAEQYVRVFPGTRSTEPHGFPSAGAYGCFQGHLGILRAARDAGARNVLVLEDDVKFLPALQEDWPGIFAALHSSAWGIVNFGFDQPASSLATSAGALVSVTEPLMLAHCYAVNGHVLPPLIQFLEALQARPYGDPAGGPMHYDGALFHFCLAHPRTPRLRPARSIAGQRSSRSDIAGGRWFDRNPLTRPLATALRALRNRF